jgi:hypothetical protein
VNGRRRPREETLRVARLISKCGEHGLEEEYPDPTAKGSKGLHWHSRRQNWTSEKSEASTAQRKDEPIQVELQLVFESVRFQMGSTKSNGARFFLSRWPGCGHDGSIVPPRRHRDQGTERRYFRRLAFRVPKETQQMASHSLKHKQRHPARRKARSPSQIASAARSYRLQLTSFLAKEVRVLYQAQRCYVQRAVDNRSILDYMSSF